MAESFARRSRLKAYGTYDDGFVDSTPAREHIQKLRDLGFPMKRIAHLAGKSHRWMRHVYDGHGTQTPPRKLSRANAETILGIPADPVLASKTGLLPALPAKRRLQALATLGWTLARLQAEAGRPDDYHYYSDLLRVAQEVTPEIDQEIRDLYARLWNQAPVFRDGRDRDAGMRSRERARRLGWYGPLDWQDIDRDPEPDVAEPLPVSYDPVVVQWTCEGRIPRKLTSDELDEVITQLNAMRVSDGRIAAMSAVSIRTIQRRRNELGLPGWTKEQQEAAA